MSWAHGQDGQCDSNDHDDHWDPIDQYLSTIIIITVIRMKIVSLTYDYFNWSIIINYNQWDSDDYTLYCYHFVSWVHNHDDHCFLVTWIRLPTVWSIIHFIILNLQLGEPNAAWFPCNSWFSIWRSMIQNWSFFVPLKQLVLHLEIHDTKLKLLCSPETFGSPFGDPWY